MSWLAYYLFLCNGLFQLQRDVTCEGYQHVDSTVKLQDVVVLRCAYPQKSKMIQLSWEKHVDGVKHRIAVYNPKLGEHIFFPYNQSVTFLSSSINGNIMLNATAADEGIYHCSINAFPEGGLLKKIAIINPAKFPGSREVDTHVQLEPGNNVTLFCGHPKGDNVAQVTWKRATEEEISTIVNFIHSQLLFIGYDYKRRFKFNYMPFENISLTIENATRNDVGIYRCHVFTNNRNWTKVFDVGVEGVTDLTKFLIIIGAVGFGALVLVTGVVTIICVRRRKKRRKNKKQLKNNTERNHQTRANQNSYSNPDVYDRTNFRAAEYQDEAIYANL